MNSLADYFCELATREGKPRMKLTSKWPRREISNIRRCVKHAFQRCRFGRVPLTITSSVTGPALGNKLASYFALKLNAQLTGFGIRSCAGQGYPDRRLVRLGNNRAYALELKATRFFEPSSRHRVILTCSSGKLRRHFVPPIHHLLLTVFYRRKGNVIRVVDYRLDFLEPSTKVNVRLEASVSHHLLANASHPHFWGAATAETQCNSASIE
jgi:hypothetical protein